MRAEELAFGKQIAHLIALLLIVDQNEHGVFLIIAKIGIVLDFEGFDLVFLDRTHFSDRIIKIRCRRMFGSS